MSEEKTDESDHQKPRFYEHIDWKIFTLIIVLVILSFFAGMMVDIPQKNNILLPENQISVERCQQQYCIDYASGVTDQVVSYINQFILNCTPSNPEAFVMLDSSGNREIGTMLRCNLTNGNSSYLPLQYSPRGVR